MEKIVDPSVWLEMPINPVYDFNFLPDEGDNKESFYESYTMDNDIKQIAVWKRIDWRIFRELCFN